MLWLDAGFGVYSDAGTTPANDTDPVRQWTCRATGLAISQSTLANRPTYRTGYLNGQPSINFDGSNDIMAGTFSVANMIGDNWTMFAVARASGTQGGLCVVGDPAVAWNGIRGDSSTWSARGSATGGADYISSAADVTNVVRVISGCRDVNANTLTVWRNGTQVAQDASLFHPTANYNSSRAVTIGAMNAASFQHAGELPEILVYNRALSTSERVAIERYLGRKYGIATS